MRARLAIATLLLLGLAACGRPASERAPAAQEISDNSVAEFCGMSLQEHPGPKGQIFLKGRAAPVWFASVRDLFAYTMLPEEPKDVTAIYVNDMGRVRDWDHPGPGNWADARSAFYVIGSHRQSGMGTREAVPFAAEATARAFAEANGGRIVRFRDMPQDYILSDFSTAD